MGFFLVVIGFIFAIIGGTIAYGYNFINDKESGLVTYIDSKTQAIDDLFKSRLENIQNVNKGRFDQLDYKIGVNSEKIDKLEAKFDKLEVKFDKLEVKVDKLTGKVNSLATKQDIKDILKAINNNK